MRNGGSGSNLKEISAQLTTTTTTTANSSSKINNKRHENNVFSRLYAQETCASSKQLYHSCNWCLKTKILASYQPKVFPTLRRFSEEMPLRPSQSMCQLWPLHSNNTSPTTPAMQSRLTKKIMMPRKNSANRIENSNQLLILREKCKGNNIISTNVIKKTTSMNNLPTVNLPIAPPCENEEELNNEDLDRKSKKKVIDWLCYRHQLTDTVVTPS